MGIKGLWKMLKPAEEEHSLSALALERAGIGEADGVRGFVVGIDAHLWITTIARAHSSTSALKGLNPELATVFYRLARLAANPVSAVLVFDGPARPGIKRKQTVVATEYAIIAHAKAFAEAFGFVVHTAPGEAEAEPAAMNAAGTVDAILSDDSDTFAFGGRVVIRSWNVKNDKDVVHLYAAATIAHHADTALTREGIILVAVLSGGDYSPGLPGCGVQTAHGLARYGLGEALVESCKLDGEMQDRALDCWREQVRTCLRTDPQQHVGRRQPALARGLPDTFPDVEVVRLYTRPLVSSHPLPISLSFDKRPPAIDVAALSRLCERHFNWTKREDLLRKFVRHIWPAVALRRVICDIQQRQTLGSASLPTDTTTFSYSIEPATTSADRKKDLRKVKLATAPLIDLALRSLVYTHGGPQAAGVVDAADDAVVVRLPGRIVRLLDARTPITPVAGPSRSRRSPSTASTTLTVVHRQSAASVPHDPQPDTPLREGSIIDLTAVSPLIVPAELVDEVIDLTHVM